MKISSLDTEVTATAPHQVAICALCVLHHCKNQTDQTFELSVLLSSRQRSFFGACRASWFSLIFRPHHTGRISFIFTKLLSANHFSSSASLYISDVIINLALASLICWHRRHIVAALTVSTEVKQDREL